MDTGHGLSDAYSPDDIARKIEGMGVRKAHADTLTLLVLAMLAGAFIAIGSLFYTVVITNSQLGFGITRLLGGLSFSLGLILVVVGGAELFTGNNLLTMAWASGQISTSSVLRNWCYSYLGNVVGAVITVVLVVLAGVDNLGDGAVGLTAVKIAAGKSHLTLIEAFLRGMFCNALVCLAVWLAMGGRSVMDKIMAIFLPVAAFVTLGFEHSIANWFFLPYGLILDDNNLISGFGCITNIIMATLGNIVGGAVQVGAVYWVAYLRKSRRAV
ncbi:formate/nitrite transporter family protein [Candidatus Electronema sp. PJ]|uniref:formate/nitrite transporter family protein n=1 Tax=Candidatus Electronema sp. PJ TaxID=3401572 RepID=UPI003AA95C67